MRKPDLPPSELSYLRCYAKGLDYSEIAIECGCSYQAVNNAFRRIRERLGTSSTVAALMIAISRGIITNPYDRSVS